MTEMKLASLRLSNLLSFGPEPTTIAWRNLNVLIGPNASGKSNLIDILGLLHQLPSDLSKVFAAGAGVRDWLWRGEPAVDEVRTGDEDYIFPATTTSPRREAGAAGTRATVQVQIDTTDENGERELHHDFGLTSEGGRPRLSAEHVESSGKGRSRPVSPTIILAALGDQSALTYRHDPESRSPIVRLQSFYRSMAIYRTWSFGRGSGIGSLERADQPDEALLPEFGNLALVLRRLRQNAATWELVHERMRDVYPRFREIQTPPAGSQGQYVELLIREDGLREATPATRLSDGTLRYLALLAILLHPEPPPLICLEEPEIGLHPDLIHILAELVVEASSRTQIVMTTHSEQLVGALSYLPDAVMVCERESERTRVNRLDGEQLRDWLKQYTLGELWRMGEIGGTRW